MKKILNFKKISNIKIKKIFNKTLNLNWTLEQNEYWSAQAASSSINKNMKKTKSRNFCLLTNRKRGHYNKLRISRTQIRDLLNTGIISGLKKSSW